MSNVNGKSLSASDDKNNIIPIRPERIVWMDGLKGFACIMVMLNHMLHLFYPAYHFGESMMSHLNGYETKLYNSPLRFVVESRINVSIFCLLSGIVVALQVMNLSNVKDKLPSIVFKRYFRLMLPVLPAGIIVWIMLKLNLFTNVAAAMLTGSPWSAQYYREPVGLATILSSVIVKMWFYGDDVVSTALWVMPQIFYGSFLTILLALLYWKMKRKAIYPYIVVFIFLIPRHDHVGAFVLGVILAMLVKEELVDIGKLLKSQNAGILAGVIFIAIGLLFGGYPDYTEPVDFYSRFNIGNVELYYNLGSFCLVLGIYNCAGIKKILSTKAFQFLGSICYEVLILHIPVLFSVGTGIIILLANMNVGYNISVIISSVITIPLIIVLSWIYGKYVGKYAGIVTNKIATYLER